MEKKELAKEIIDFSIKYGLFNNSENMKAACIEKQLNESWFLELLVQALIEARYKENIDHRKLSELLSELEKTRLDSEYYE